VACTDDVVPGRRYTHTASAVGHTVYVYGGRTRTKPVDSAVRRCAVCRDSRLLVLLLTFLTLRRRCC
jgi:hypothetical protein